MSSESASPERAFGHLGRLSDQRGLFEHAQGSWRRPEHGYCTDDNARLLVVTAREQGSAIPRLLGASALEFVLAAQERDGRIHNRMDHQGHWTDVAGTEDCWGRALWGLGVIATRHHDLEMRRTAKAAFNRSARLRAKAPRSMAFAALGAADALNDDGDHALAYSLLVDAITVIDPGSKRRMDAFGRVQTAAALDSDWPWPEQSLTYANATLAEALIAAGSAARRDEALERGLGMLAWLLERESRGGHLSVTPAQGSTRAANTKPTGPLFDQQPIEVAAMADACMRAYDVTRDLSWLRGITMARQWYEGDNDAGLMMYDPVSGGSFDGLHADAVNRNQGAESTLALVSTLQHARAIESLVGARELNIA